LQNPSALTSAAGAGKKKVVVVVLLREQDYCHFGRTYKYPAPIYSWTALKEKEGGHEDCGYLRLQLQLRSDDDE
jgi:hypothetical protein